MTIPSDWKVKQWVDILPSIKIRCRLCKETTETGTRKAAMEWAKNHLMKKHPEA